MLPCGAAVGLSCSTLWTAMRLYVKRVSLTFDAALGSDAPAGGSLGNFNGVAEGGATLGTLGAMLGSSLLMQRFGPRRQLIFGGLAVVAAIGNFVLFTIPTPSLLLAEPRSTSQGKAGVSLLALPRLVAKSAPLRCLLVSFCCVGCSNSFGSVNQPLLLRRRSLLLTACRCGQGTFTADAAAPALGQQWLGYVVAARAGCSTLGSLLLGKLSDRIGRYPVLLGSAALEIGASLYLALPSALASLRGNHARVFGLAAAMGIGYSGTRLMASTMTGDLMEDADMVTALSGFSLCNGIASGSSFLLGPNAVLATKARLLGTVALCSLLAASVGVVPALRKKKKEAAAGAKQG